MENIITESIFEIPSTKKIFNNVLSLVSRQYIKNINKIKNEDLFNEINKNILLNDGFVLRGEYYVSKYKINLKSIKYIKKENEFENLYIYVKFLDNKNFVAKFVPDKNIIILNYDLKFKLSDIEEYNSFKNSIEHTIKHEFMHFVQYIADKHKDLKQKNNTPIFGGPKKSDRKYNQKLDHSSRDEEFYPSILTSFGYIKNEVKKANFDKNQALLISKLFTSSISKDEFLKLANKDLINKILESGTKIGVIKFFYEIKEKQYKKWKIAVKSIFKELEKEGII